MSDVVVRLPDADATRAYGRALAGVLRAGDLLVLTGDLGAGKTTLTQGIGAGLGVRGQVASPTFIIARVHPGLVRDDGTAGPDLVHVDAYRLSSLDEVEALDLDSSLEDAVTVVEWGQGWVESIATDRLEVAITRPRGGTAPGDDAVDDDGGAGERVVTLRAVGERWAGVDLAALGDTVLGDTVIGDTVLGDTALGDTALAVRADEGSATDQGVAG